MKKVKEMVKGHKHNKKNPIANNVKFEVVSEKLTVTYTDYKNTVIELTFVAEEVEDMGFLLSIDIVKNLSTTKDSIHEFKALSTYEVEHVENEITHKYSLMDTNNYYKHNYVNNEFTKMITLDYDAIQKVKMANISASKSESRPVLQTVLLRNNSITSTDSHRLYQSNANSNLIKDVLIPSHVVRLLNAFTNKGDSITISMDRDILKVSNDDFTIYCDEVFGNFPEVSRLIPQDFNTIVEIMEFDKFKKTLEAIKKTVKDRNKVVKFHFEKGTGKMKLTNYDDSIQTEISIKEINGYSIEFSKIALSAAYMLDAIKQLNTKQIRLKFVSNMRPFIVEEANGNSETLTLILPVRLV
jgi:DNA polymerase-3 subunit beta